MKKTIEKKQTAADKIPEESKVTDEEKEIIKQAVFKATQNGWFEGAWVLMKFPTLNVPFIFHSFFSDSKWAQAYFGKDWIQMQHEMLTINQSEGASAVVQWLKKHNVVIVKPK